MARDSSSDSRLFQEFQQHWQEVSGEYYPVCSMQELVPTLKRFLTTGGFSKVALSGLPLPGNISDALGNAVEVLIDFGKDDCTLEDAKRICSRAEVGITSADGVIADTGTIVIQSGRPGDMICSLLPPVHIVVLYDTPIFPDWKTCINEMQFEGTATFITGPSRTADIEKQLVLGAHGPKRVIVMGTVKPFGSSRESVSKIRKFISNPQ